MSMLTWGGQWHNKHSCYDVTTHSHYWLNKDLQTVVSCAQWIVHTPTQCRCATKKHSFISYIANAGQHSLVALVIFVFKYGSSLITCLQPSYQNKTFISYKMILLIVHTMQQILVNITVLTSNTAMMRNDNEVTENRIIWLWAAT